MVETFDTAVQRDSGSLVSHGRNDGVETIAADGKGTNRETVGVAADDGVGVLLGYMSRGVFGTNQYVVCLCTL